MELHFKGDMLEGSLDVFTGRGELDRRKGEIDTQASQRKSPARGGKKKGVLKRPSCR